MNRINRNRYIASVMALLLGVMTAALHAAEQAGKILYARGTVSIVDVQDSARGGRTGAALFEGDRIVTGTGAIAQIRLSDGALVALRGSSDYQIETQQYDEEEGLYEQAGKLFTGWMRSITGAIGQKYPQKVSQSTTVATIGIRGTTYQVISIPPEGLPEYPGEEPGTYVLLEEGQVEITGDAGSRLLKPGDIVFIPAAGGAPQLRPEKNGIFKRPGRRIVREVLERREEFSEEVNRTLIETLLARRGQTVAMGFVDGVRFVTVDGILTQFDPSAGRVLTGMRIDDSIFDGYDSFAVTNSEAFPYDTGRHVFANGDVANWGTWASFDYQGFNTSDSLTEPFVPSQDWKWLVAGGGLSPSAVSSAGFTGVATYYGVGGTPISGTLGFYDVKDAGINLDFATGGMDINLVVSDGEVTYELSAGNSALDPSTASLQQFYQDGVSLADAAASLFGSMEGALIAGGYGIGATIDLFDGFGNNATGVGVFERLPTGGVRAALGFVDNFGQIPFLAGPQRATVTPGADASRLLTRLEMEGGFSTEPVLYRVLTPNEGPLEYGAHTFSNGNRVDWGIWSTSDYEGVDEFGFSVTPQKGWKWSVADGVLLSPLQFASAGLFGTATYDYVGGTSLAGASSLYTVQDGFIEVDFATGAINAGLDILDQVAVPGPAPWTLSANNGGMDPGIANIGQLYRDGINLNNDPGNAVLFANIQGAFVANGEGIASNVTIQDSQFNEATGVAVFEKAPAQVVVP